MTSHSEAMYHTVVKNVDFQEWPKTPRLLKDMTVTEKIDGTNACVVIVPAAFGAESEAGNLIDVVFGPPTDKEGGFPELEYHIFAQSRKRMITPQADNAGFASWVRENGQALVDTLGPGRHYGEWWGRGIQRTYGADRKTFSLFNTDKWGNLDPIHELWGLSVVPELHRGPFDTAVVHHLAEQVWETSNVGSPGWDGSGEGVCVFHHASRTVFKVTDEGDKPKGGPRDAHGNPTTSGSVVALPTKWVAPDPDDLLVAA